MKLLQTHHLHIYALANGHAFAYSCKKACKSGTTLSSFVTQFTLCVLELHRNPQIANNLEKACFLVKIYSGLPQNDQGRRRPPHVILIRGRRPCSLILTDQDPVLFNCKMQL